MNTLKIQNSKKVHIINLRGETPSRSKKKIVVIFVPLNKSSDNIEFNISISEIGPRYNKYRFM